VKVGERYAPVRKSKPKKRSEKPLATELRESEEPRGEAIGTTLQQPRGTHRREGVQFFQTAELGQRSLKERQEVNGKKDHRPR